MHQALIKRDADLYYEIGAAVWRFDSRDWVGRLPQPAMIIVPTADEVVPPETQYKLASLLPGTFFCQSCRQCIPSCPQRVDIPTLMRAYMYAEAYENRVQAGETLASLPRELGLETCTECDSCSATCHRGLPIGTRVGELSRSNLLA